MVKIISGAQTGVDRGALDAAFEVGTNLPDAWVGYCPFGRKAEDGVVPEKYRMTEWGDYKTRTEHNVMKSEATLIFKRGSVGPGTTLTMNLVLKHKKAFKVIDLPELDEEQNILDHTVSELPQSIDYKEVAKWMSQFAVVNVAGSRESSHPGIQKQVKDVMMQILNELPRYP